jgi:hypothetical protein
MVAANYCGNLFFAPYPTQRIAPEAEFAGSQTA